MWSAQRLRGSLEVALTSKVVLVSIVIMSHALASFLGQRGESELPAVAPDTYADNRIVYAAFNHEQHPDVEAEYDRLRDAARKQAELRGSCFERVRFLSNELRFLYNGLTIYLPFPR